MRHTDFVSFHDFHHSLQCLRYIDLPHGNRTEFFDKVSQIAVELVAVRFSPELSEVQNSIGNHGDVFHSETFNTTDHNLSFPLSQPSHHAHIEPDDFSVPNFDIPGVRIRMEEAVIHDLMNIVVYEFCAYFIKVILFSQKRILVVDRYTVHIFHDKDPGSRILPVELRNINIAEFGVVGRELFDVRSFLEEIHLFLRDHPEFVEDHVEIDDIAQIADRRKHPDCFVQKTDITSHLVVDSLALDLYNDFLTCVENGFVDLRYGGGTQRCSFDGCKYFLPRMPV